MKKLKKLLGKNIRKLFLVTMKWKEEVEQMVMHIVSIVHIPQLYLNL